MRSSQRVVGRRDLGLREAFGSRTLITVNGRELRLSWQPHIAMDPREQSSRMTIQDFARLVLRERSEASDRVYF